MKRNPIIISAILIIALLASCTSPAQSGEWTTEGMFTDDDGNIVSITWMEDVDEPGWYVGCMFGIDYIEDAWGGMLNQVGDTLTGELPTYGQKEPITVTVTASGDSIDFAIKGGETYHLTYLDLPKATIFVTVNVEGWGNIDYAPGEIAPEFDPQYPFQSAVINLAEPEVHTFAAWPVEGWKFVCWTKNGEPFSTEPQITLLLDESADYIAVFEQIEQ